MKKKWQIVTTGIAALVVTLGFGMPANAESSSPEVISPATSYLATPEELASLGFGAAAITAQQTAWEDLTQSERAQEEALRSEQEGASIGLSAVPRHHLPLPVAGEVSPATVYPQSCNDQPNGYKIGAGSGSSATRWTCYTGSGIFDYGANELTDVINLRPGNYKGRVLYHVAYSTTYYWSVDRGPNDFSTYPFDPIVSPYSVKEVQLY